MVVYNETSGSVISQSNTPQGYPNGVWSRGEGWALYGFVKAYMYTGYDRYLQMAVTIGDYFISQLPQDYIPYWDFDHPESKSQRDTSAASLAATAFYTLSSLVSASDGMKYKKVSTEIMTSLAMSYEGEPTKTDCMLLQGCIGDGPAANMDVSLIYGDYYFVECLIKMAGDKKI